MRTIPNARRLQYFLQVTVTGSVRGASEVLGVDPSSISRAISQLEKELNLHLLERKGRGVIPTETGRTLARYARRQTELLESLHNELRQSKDAARGHVNVGLGEGMLDVLFNPVITNYMHDNPLITLSLSVSSVEQNISDIVEDKMDIGLLYGVVDDVRLRHHISLPASPIQAIVHKDHPLTRIKRPLMLTDLAPYNGATLHARFGLHQYIRAAEISEQTRLKHALFTSSYRALWQYANAGLGYTLCGTSFIAWFNMPDLVALPMSNPIFNQSSIAIITRTGRHISPAANSLLQHIVAHITQHAMPNQSPFKHQESDC